MNDQPVFSSLNLRHQPYGEQHPYIPLPYERFPRDPLAGQPVTLGIETELTPKADWVGCTWNIEGSAETHAMDAVKQKDGETADLWQVQLPAFNGGDRIHYRFVARSGARQTESEEFSFSVPTWVDILSVTAVEEYSDRLAVKLSTSRPGLFVRLLASSAAVGPLDLQFSAFYEENQTLQPALHNPLKVKLGGVHLSLDGSPVKLSFTRESDGLVLQSTDPMRVLVKEDGSVLQYKLGFESPSDEAFYGFGERFNALNQRGNRLDNYVYGQYTGQGRRSYIPMPFFISSRAYGVWLQTERQADFDLAAEESHCWSLAGRVEEENAGMQIKFFFQPHPREIVKAFTSLTGKPEVPAAWVFGPWMSSNDWNSQAEVLKQLHLTQSYQIPATVLVIEAWSDEINFYIWNDAQYPQKPSSQSYQLKDFTFPPDARWTDPKAMTDELHQAGVRLVLWQNPTIKQSKPGENLDETLNKADQAYAIEQGFVVRKADGSPHRVEAHMPWFGGSLVVDFTNPEAAEWWCKKREYLVSEVGVDGFKTDGGEHIWDPETRFYNGLRGTRGINNYPLDYERVYQRFMQNHRGEDYVLFSRAGYTGAQQIPCHWAGDENSTWDAYRATLRAMFNIGLCGVPFFGWDIAGFAGPLPSSELYLRATAFSVFCPIMQYHSDVNGRRKPSRDRTPWNIQEQTGNPEVISTFRKFADLRMNLFPYILSQAGESSQSGLPLMRTLALEYPQDAAVRDFPYEYLFGDALLVAPVVEEGADTWPVYLPEGEWRELWSGEVQHGPAVIKMKVPFDRIPVFQKQGSVLPLHLGASGELCSPVGNSVEPAEHLTLQVFPVEKTALPVSLSIEAVSNRVVSIIHEEEAGMRVQVPAATQSLDVRICGSEPNSVSIDEKSLPRLAEGAFSGAVSGWQWNPQKQETRIHLSRISSAVRIQVQ